MDSSREIAVRYTIQQSVCQLTLKQTWTVQILASIL